MAKDRLVKPLGLFLIGIIILAIIGQTPIYARQNVFADPAFEAIWQRTDAAVVARQATASWLWGPEPLSAGLREPYAQSPDGTRLVQYFDKARMEINHPTLNRNTPWFVTNGLLPIELITGQVQTGDARFEQRSPAKIAAIGDPDNAFPTYADLARVFTRQGSETRTGAPVTTRLQQDGSISSFPDYRTDPATLIAAVENGHGIPRAFLVHMETQSRELGRLFVFGMPVSSAYWVMVRVGGVEQPVMFQVFERRILTYTPRNPPPFQVESGNVGRHCLQWRYPAPVLDVSPSQGPAGSAFTLRITGLPLGEQAVVTVTPAPADPVLRYTVTGSEQPVTLTIPTSTDSSQGTWAVTVQRTAISPIIQSVVRFVVTAP